MPHKSNVLSLSLLPLGDLGELVKPSAICLESVHFTTIELRILSDNGYIGAIVEIVLCVIDREGTDRKHLEAINLSFKPLFTKSALESATGL